MVREVVLAEVAGAPVLRLDGCRVQVGDAPAWEVGQLDGEGSEETAARAALIFEVLSQAGPGLDRADGPGIVEAAVLRVRAWGLPEEERVCAVVDALGGEGGFEGSRWRSWSGGPWRRASSRAARRGGCRCLRRWWRM